MLELICALYLSLQLTGALLCGLAVSLLATQPTAAKLFIHLVTAAACLSLLQIIGSEKLGQCGGRPTQRREQRESTADQVEEDTM